MRSINLKTAAVCGLAAALLIGSQAVAAESAKTTSTAPVAKIEKEVPPAPKGEKMMPSAGGNPAMHEAMMACRESIAKEANGMPDRKAMHDCMKQKGFEPPMHRGAGGPPPAAE